MVFIDTSHPIYRPLWVRLLIVGFSSAWTVVEFVNNQMFWAMIVGAVALYSAYMLLLTYKPPQDKAEEVVSSPEPD